MWKPTTTEPQQGKPLLRRSRRKEVEKCRGTRRACARAGLGRWSSDGAASFSPTSTPFSTSGFGGRGVRAGTSPRPPPRHGAIGGGCVCCWATRWNGCWLRLDARERGRDCTAQSSWVQTSPFLSPALLDRGLRVPDADDDPAFSSELLYLIADYLDRATPCSESAAVLRRELVRRPISNDAKSSPPATLPPRHARLARQTLCPSFSFSCASLLVFCLRPASPPPPTGVQAPPPGHPRIRRATSTGHVRGLPSASAAPSSGLPRASSGRSVSTPSVSEPREPLFLLPCRRDPAPGPARSGRRRDLGSHARPGDLGPPPSARTHRCSPSDPARPSSPRGGSRGSSGAADPPNICAASVSGGGLHGSRAGAFRGPSFARSPTRYPRASRARGRAGFGAGGESLAAAHPTASTLGAALIPTHPLGASVWSVLCTLILKPGPPPTRLESSRSPRGGRPSLPQRVRRTPVSIARPPSTHRRTSDGCRRPTLCVSVVLDAPVSSCFGTSRIDHGGAAVFVLDPFLACAASFFARLLQLHCRGRDHRSTASARSGRRARLERRVLRRLGPNRPRRLLSGRRRVDQGVANRHGSPARLPPRLLRAHRRPCTQRRRPLPGGRQRTVRRTVHCVASRAIRTRSSPRVRVRVRIRVVFRCLVVWVRWRAIDGGDAARDPSVGHADAGISVGAPRTRGSRQLSRVRSGVRASRVRLRRRRVLHLGPGGSVRWSL